MKNFLAAPTTRFILVATCLTAIMVVWFAAYPREKPSRGTATINENRKMLLPFSDACGEGLQRVKCWDDAIQDAFNGRGLDAAFDLVDEFYRTEIGIRAECHGLVHRLGETTYQRYSGGRELAVSGKSRYCGYGFYHGFMEALLATTGDARRAREFCASVHAQLLKSVPGASSQCFHGIGHGAVTPHDPNVWGDAKAILQPALELCALVTEEEPEYTECLSGVFNGLAEFYRNGEYVLNIDPEDPLWICREEPERHKLVCYGLMARVLLGAVEPKNDFRKATELAARTAPERFLGTVVSNLAALEASIKIAHADDTSIISTCRSLGNTVSGACLTGYVVGLFEFGEPKTEYTAAIDFCQNSLLLEEERNVCFTTTLSSLGKFYPREKINDICATVPKEYRGRCG